MVVHALVQPNYATRIHIFNLLLRNRPTTAVHNRHVTVALVVISPYRRYECVAKGFIILLNK